MLPLLSEEKFSDIVTSLLSEDADATVWWGTWAECSVAVSRLVREGKLEDEDGEEMRLALDRFAADWAEIRPTDDLRLLAALLSNDQPLKTADCFQLAAALRWCEGDTQGASFVCLDNQLRRSAEDEGFDVLPERGQL